MSEQVLWHQMKRSDGMFNLNSWRSKQLTGRARTLLGFKLLIAAAVYEQYT